MWLTNMSAHLVDYYCDIPPFDKSVASHSYSSNGGLYLVHEVNEGSVGGPNIMPLDRNATCFNIYSEGQRINSVGIEPLTEKNWLDLFGLLNLGIGTGIIHTFFISALTSPFATSCGGGGA